MAVVGSGPCRRSTPTSTSTRSSREPAAGTATWSTWPWWGGARASAWSAPATSPTRRGSRSCRRPWCRPSRGCSGCGRTLERSVEARLPASCRGPVRFLLSVEISTIYKRAERTRKVHHLLYMPDLGVGGAVHGGARRGSATWPRTGGRSSASTRATCWRSPWRAGEGAYLVPAHVWTPWFARAGLEVGLRPGRGLLRRPGRAHLRARDGAVVRPGDELAGVGAGPLPAGQQLRRPLAAGAGPGGDGAGHRASTTAPSGGRWRPARGSRGRSSSSPRRASTTSTATARAASAWSRPRPARHGGRCPVCGKPPTVGVLHRVEELADRPDGHPPGRGGRVPQPRPAAPSWSARSSASAPGARRSPPWSTGLVDRLGPELDDPASGSRPTRSPGPARPWSPRPSTGVRRGAVLRDAGYDGEYGTIRVFTPDELRSTPADRGPVRPDPIPATSAPPPRPRSRPRAPSPPRPRPTPAPSRPRPPEPTRAPGTPEPHPPDAGAPEREGTRPTAAPRTPHLPCRVPRSRRSPTPTADR